eukprot:gnl/MRDRNA2_/MRDRNA2_28892_c0_seq1.p1 gnl/MRDRNA2_/MRDRNA2_28892_c0~~gnl/MRDRNA2_/MRDRNA2_28892_c0_seq1.p1  ORF type:complete len:186 (+),score=49.78 gnl/MRDRNA2_/MRDRNA2_28892_c0_seq1:93-650(+)
MAFDPTPYCTPGEVTVSEVQDMKRAFDMLDEDRSGVIDVEELQSAAYALGIPMDDNIELLLGSDKITFDEFFKRMTAKLSPEDTIDTYMKIFELFDQDGTGTISMDNLSNVARIIGASEDARQIQDMLNTLDTDGDGELDPIDFYTCLVSGMRVRMEEEERRKYAQMQEMGGSPGRQSQLTSIPQ